MGPAGLTHGQLNDRVQFDVTVTIAAGGKEAWARGIELGMLGEADQEKGWWEVATFRNRFVNEGGVWKIREMRRFPLMKTDIFLGWGKSRIVDPVPVAPAGLARLCRPPMPRRRVWPCLPSSAASGDRQAGPACRQRQDGRGERAHRRDRPGQAGAVTLEEARRRLARSAAFDGITNVSAAYGYYLDDSMPAGFGGIMAAKGFKMTPFSGYYVGRDRVLSARVSGDATENAGPAFPITGSSSR